MKRLHRILIGLFLLSFGALIFTNIFFPTSSLSLSYNFAIYRPKYHTDKYKTFLKNIKLEENNLVPINDIHNSNVDNSCENWFIIVATRKPGTVINDIKSRTEASDGMWCCVVVLDTDENIESKFMKFNKERFIVLSRKEQKKLVDSNTGYSSVKNVTSQSYTTMKTIGYLYAIRHGANLIFDAHEDYRLPEGVVPYTDSLSEFVVVSSTEHVFNPYKYYYSDPWEVLKLDGLPVQYSWNFKNTHYEIVKEDNCTANRRKVGVMQFLTKHEATPERYVKQKSNELPLLMNRGTLMPYNSQSTLHHYSSFFGLHLTSTANNGMADALRAYYTQRLMWDIKTELAVAKPLMEYLTDTETTFASNWHISVPDHLITFLNGWQSKSNSLIERMEELALELYEKSFWEEEELNNIHKWIGDLKMTGYKFPQLIPTTSEDLIHQKEDCQNTDMEIPVEENSKKKADNVKRGKLELFLRMSTGNGELKIFYHLVFDWSLRFFWHNETSPMNLLLILDDEREDDHIFGKERENIYPFPTLHFEKPNSYYGTYEHSRMQWSMFWADQFATGDYVGFLDTDTLFVSLTYDDVLFDGDKPIVWGMFGVAGNHHWGYWKLSTYEFFKEKQIFKTMNYFPVIIWVKHLIAIRKHIENVHGKPFNEVFLSILNTCPISQFNIMFTYLWYFHRNEYVWYMEERKGSQNFDGPDEITDFHDVTDIMRMPYPKFSIHYRYIFAVKIKVEPGFNTKSIDGPGQKTRNNLMLEGYCYSHGFKNTPEMCRRFDVNVLQDSLFEFEDHSWSWDSRCITAQQKHYSSLTDVKHKWDPEILATISSD